MLKTLAKHSVVAFFIFFGPDSEPMPEPETVFKSVFEAAIIEEAESDQWQWYCDDSRDVAPVEKVVYPSGRVVYHDPDVCDSAVAKSGRDSAT